MSANAESDVSSRKSTVHLPYCKPRHESFSLGPTQQTQRSTKATSLGAFLAAVAPPAPPKRSGGSGLDEHVPALNSEIAAIGKDNALFARFPSKPGLFVPLPKAS